MTRQVLGHSVCSVPGCDNLVADLTAKVTRGMCEPCWDESQADRQAAIAVLVDGATSRLKPEGKHRKKRQLDHARVKRKGTPANQVRNRQAKAAAQRRLGLLWPAELLVLLADERARLGLPPWGTYHSLQIQRVLEREGRTIDEVVKTLEERAAYAARDGQAQDLEAPGD